MSTSKARKVIAQAERALEDGKPDRALELLDNVSVQDDALDRRLARVVAVARLRTNQVSQAASILKGLLRQTPDDPYLKTRMAEALSLWRKDREKNQKEARDILEELAKGDLIPDAEGYLALARLRAEAADGSGSEKALQQCKQRARSASLCVLPARS